MENGVVDRNSSEEEMNKERHGSNSSNLSDVIHKGYKVLFEGVVKKPPKNVFNQRAPCRNMILTN